MNITKLSALSGLIMLLLTPFSGCEQDTSLQRACGVENPIENLPWLKNTIDSFNTSQIIELTSVDLYEYESKEIIQLTWKLKDIYDIPTGSIYNCNGEQLYLCGGNQPIDSCVYVISNSKFIGCLWSAD